MFVFNHLADLAGNAFVVGWWTNKALRYREQRQQRKATGMKIGNVRVGNESCEFVWNGDVVHLTFNPNEHTPEAEAVWEKESANGFAGGLAIDFIVRQLVSWDILGELVEVHENPDDPESPVIRQELKDADGPLPITRDVVKLLPFPFIETMMTEMSSVGKPRRRIS